MATASTWSSETGSLLHSPWSSGSGRPGLLRRPLPSEWRPVDVLASARERRKPAAASIAARIAAPSALPAQVPVPPPTAVATPVSPPSGGSEVGAAVTARAPRPEYARLPSRPSLRTVPAASVLTQPTTTLPVGGDVTTGTAPPLSLAGVAATPQPALSPPAAAAAALLLDPGFGSAADLAAHRRDATCWLHYDFGYLEEWAGTAAPFCGADSATPGVGGSAGLTCRGHVDAHLPPPTGPHVLCDARELVVDYSKLTPTVCLESRPGYKCDGLPVHYSFARGALSAACDTTPAFSPSAFPRDHLMDMLGGGFAGAGVGAAAAHAAIASAPAPVTLFVARERGEHANLFHATTDLLNAFMALAMLNVTDGLVGGRAGMASVAVVLLDEQTGPFEDAFWGKVFSPRFPLRRASDMGGAAVRYPHAVFVPPGYTNLLLAAVLWDGDCHAPAGSHLFHAFRRFVLRGLGTPEDVVTGRAWVAAAGGGVAAATAISGTNSSITTSSSSGSSLPSGGGGGSGSGSGIGPLVATFVSRRPYVRHGVDHHAVGRQIDNEEELLAALGGVAGVSVARLDFAQLEVEEQVAVVARSDVLIGMHGAALTHALYLPPHAGVLELWPKPSDIWRCFEHAATLAGLHYVRWANEAYPAGYRDDEGGDYTTVHAGEVAALLRVVVAAVTDRRAQAAAAAAAGEAWPR